MWHNDVGIVPDGHAHEINQFLHQLQHPQVMLNECLHSDGFACVLTIGNKYHKAEEPFN